MSTILRDDSALRSLSSNERSFVRSCATATSSSSESAVLRADGRHPGEIRSIRLTFGRTNFGRSECTVQHGLTRVCCIVTCDLVPPQTRPNDGSIKFSVDLSPMAAMGFSGGLEFDEYKKHTTNRIARIVEKTIVDGGAIDVESLCVVGGTWVWRINVDITALDHGGNLVDVSMLATIAALRHFRKPEVILPNSANGDITYDTNTTTTRAATTGAPIILSSDEKEPTPLPLHHSPVCVSFGLFGDPTGASLLVAALIDPSDREELIMDGCITYAFNKYGELCGLDFSGGCELRQSQLVQCANLAEKKAVELCLMLEEALEAAEKKASMERMERLQKLSTETFAPTSNSSDGLFSTPETVSAPLVAEQLQPTMAPTNTQDDSALAEEEKYRLEALDYSLGHKAVKVKENNLKDTRNRNNQNLGGKLIEAMIRSAANSNSIAAKASSDTSANIMSIIPIDTGNLNAESVKNNDDDDVDNISATRKKKTEAEDEFAAYAISAGHKGFENSPVAAVMEVDDEEEEGITFLQSEFAVIESSGVAQVVEKEKAGDQAVEDEMDEIDLSMAIKRKSKSTKKKGKT